MNTNLHIQKFEFNLFGENCYILWDESGECAIVDPGCERLEERKALNEFIKTQGLTPQMILLTHAHLDHIYGVRELMDIYKVKTYMDPREESSINRFNPGLTRLGLPLPQDFEFTPVSEGELLHFGNTDIRALSTSGHSQGGLCWWCEKEKALFTGDTLFAGSIGRTDNDCASLDTLLDSIRGTLMCLDSDIDVFPGHGPATSIGQERLTNPFINLS